jgi:hypothetical protein
MLKTGIAFLAGLLFFTVLIEAGNRGPSPISTGLSGLGIESSGKRVLLSSYGAIALQVIARNTTAIHPHAQAFVADELHDTNGLINGLVLVLVAIEFVCVDQHDSPSCVHFLLENRSF